MGNLYRSQEMVLCQLYLQNETAYACISKLGEQALVQFRNINPIETESKKKFKHHVTRCENIEHKLEQIEEQIKIDEIPIEDFEDIPSAPLPKELTDLEATVNKIELELSDVTNTYDNLEKTFYELTELKEMLKEAQKFFESQETSPTSESFDHTNLVQDKASATQHCFITGVIPQDRMHAFEMMLWRVCRGKVYIKQVFIENLIADPSNFKKVYKSVFILFFQGDQLKERVRKICHGFHATLYPCPENEEDRKEMLQGVRVRLHDLARVVNQTKDHRYRVLVNAAKSIKQWLIKVRKVKSIYAILNLFAQDKKMGKKGEKLPRDCVIGECWCARSNLPVVQQLLREASEQSGSSVPSIINPVETNKQHPTYFPINKFTAGFQNIVDAYGVARYQEINPAPYTIITFPFLFSVMFGDSGHGLILFLFALWMILNETKLMASKSENDIWLMLFGGRYIILLMGAFSIYNGMMYNDIFSKSVNLFGTTWDIPQNLSMDNSYLTINPSVSFFHRNPYLFGIDPIWQSAKNKILFLNSYKMKISIVLGVAQMLFGVILSCVKFIHFGEYLHIFCEFIPQLLFFLAIFGNLVVMIFLKWVMYDSTQSSCAPSLLISLINMFLMKYQDEPCYLANMYELQQTVQTILVLISLICVPWMLLIKPIIQVTTKKHYDLKPDGTPAAEGFGDLFILQTIHTIEYCLGTISHTASYLRLWALSLAHAQLSEVLWHMIFQIAIRQTTYVAGVISLYIIFAVWAILTIGILLVMEGLSAFLHALRLHWVEFQSKFYKGDGKPFVPFSFKDIEAGHPIELQPEDLEAEK